MKTRYQQSKTTRTSRHVVIPLVLLFSAALLYFTQAQIPHSLQRIGHALSSPLWGVRDTLLAGVGVTTETFSSKKKLLQENAALREDILEMRRTNFFANTLIAENEALRMLLGRAGAEDMYIPAAVINAASYSPYDSFVIDLGAEDGLREDMLVITPEGLAIGSIVATLRRSAIVRRFSAPEVVFTATIQASTTLHTQVTGQGAGTMLLSVPRDIAVHQGDAVVLPNFPGNPVGTISRIEASPEDAYQTVYVLHEASQYNLRHVLVDLVHTWKPEVASDSNAQPTPTAIEPAS